MHNVKQKNYPHLASAEKKYPSSLSFSGERCLWINLRRITFCRIVMLNNDNTQEQQKLQHDINIMQTTAGKHPTKSKWTRELEQLSRRQLSFSKNRNICLKKFPIVNCTFISIHHVWHSPCTRPNTYPSRTCGGTIVQSFASVCCFNAHKGLFAIMQCSVSF